MLGKVIIMYLTVINMLDKDKRCKCCQELQQKLHQSDQNYPVEDNSLFDN